MLSNPPLDVFKQHAAAFGWSPQVIYQAVVQVSGEFGSLRGGQLVWRHRLQVFIQQGLKNAFDFRGQASVLKIGAQS